MKYFFSLLFLLFLLPSSVRAASNWYYPLSQFTSRQSDKAFGQHIDKQWYVGKEARFPNQFVGYHAAIDLEIFSDELNQLVPVYAVGNGKIVYAAPVSGYGGLILEQLTSTRDTALYGHVKLTDLPFRVGDTITAGTRLTYLGDAFSSQTGGERKHLHFGIYKGTDLYFRGYEPTLSTLNNRWLNPTDFLANHSAVDPQPMPTIAQTPITSPALAFQTFSPSFFQRILSFILGLLHRL